MFEQPEILIMLAAQIVISALYLVALMRYTRHGHARAESDSRTVTHTARHKTSGRATSKSKRRR